MCEGSSTDISKKTACSDPDNHAGVCQQRIFSLEGTLSNVDVYNLNTVRTPDMIVRDGTVVAKASDNTNEYNDNIARFSLS